MSATLTTTTCAHTTYRVRRATPFSGPANGPTECRAAHGGHTEHQECCGCGARRQVNCNGPHVEVGCWQGSTAQRRALAAQATAAYDAALASAEPRSLHHRDGRAVQVVVGLDDVSERHVLLVRGPQPHPSREQVLAALPELARACLALDAARTAWERAQDAI